MVIFLAMPEKFGRNHGGEAMNPAKTPTQPISSFLCLFYIDLTFQETERDRFCLPQTKA
jgi:hypothetical protein